jgi:hypothetical protein
MQNPDTREMPQQEAWKTLSEVYGPAKLNLQKANAMALSASVQRDAAASLAARKEMLAVALPALEKAGITVPPALDEPKLDASLSEAQTKAEEAYEATLKQLQENVIDAPGSSESEQAAKNAGQVLMAITRYGQAQLARVVNDDAAAKKHMSEAVQLVKSGQGMEMDAYPLYLRTALGLAPAATTTGPTSRPAARPGAAGGAAAGAGAAGAATQPATAPTE